MKKMGKILSLLLALVMCFGMFGGMTVYADEVSDATVESDDETTETTGEENVALEGYCFVTIKLDNIDTDETDNIRIEFKNKSTGEKKQTTFKKADGWVATIYLAPGKHTIDFKSADDNRTIELREEVLEVADAKSAAVSLTVEDIVNDNFWPKFFRNNTFTLILLAASSITYFVLKKRREAMQGSR